MANRRLTRQERLIVITAALNELMDKGQFEHEAGAAALLGATPEELAPEARKLIRMVRTAAYGRLHALARELRGEEAER